MKITQLRDGLFNGIAWGASYHTMEGMFLQGREPFSFIKIRVIESGLVL